jgi:hypothetical protein
MAKAKVESIFRKKVKRSGKAKKSFGPKEARPKKYRGQGR